MKKIITLLFLIAPFLNVIAQKTDSIPCPSIKLYGPMENKVAEGNDAIISVKSFKKEFNKTHTISYEWISDNGVITDGQNKSTVYIDTKGLAGQQIKAVVKVNGLDPACISTATINIEVIKPIAKIEQRIIGRPAN